MRLRKSAPLPRPRPLTIISATVVSSLSATMRRRSKRTSPIACPPRRLAIAALNALRHYPWPGNLAELESVVKDLAFTSLEEEVQLDDVERALAARAAPGALPEVAFDRPYREAREAFERVYFEHLLAREHGSMSRVAERSGLERTHLYRKLKALGLPVGRREES